MSIIFYQVVKLETDKKWCITSVDFEKPNSFSEKEINISSDK